MLQNPEHFRIRAISVGADRGVRPYSCCVFFSPFRKISDSPTRTRNPPNSFRSSSAFTPCASSAPPTAQTLPASAAGQTACQTICLFLI